VELSRSFSGSGEEAACRGLLFISRAWQGFLSSFLFSPSLLFLVLPSLGGLSFAGSLRFFILFVFFVALYNAWVYICVVFFLFDFFSLHICVHYFFRRSPLSGLAG